MEKKTMQAVVFSAPATYEVTERPIPEIGAEDEMLIKILAASICGTDVHILADPPGVAANTGIILGHECVGEVVKVGKRVRGFRPGDHLILDNNLTCGVCPACRSGHSNMCTNVRSMGVHIDGVFAEYAVAPESACVKIPANIPLRKAIFAEPLNCVMGAIKKLKIMPGDTAVVLGGGPIGLYFTGLLRACGAGRVIVSEVSSFRSDFAKINGADRVVNPVQEDLQAAVLAETEGVGADIVIDAVGSLITDALRTARPGGQILLFGMNAKASAEIHQNDITSRDLKLMGNFIGLHTLTNVANVLRTGVVDFENMITHELPLSRFGEGLEAMRKGQALEVVLYPGE